MTLIDKIDAGEIELLIFDCDGTLYRMEDRPFPETRFYQEIRRNAARLIESLEGHSTGLERLLELEKDFGLELSQAFRESFCLSNDEYFEQTWGKVDPSLFVNDKDCAREIIESLAAHCDIALLSNAPRVWCTRVIEYLGLPEAFGSAMWTGEEEIRKPMDEAFERVMQNFGKSPAQTAMIGDEEKNDIIVPNKLGIYTVRVNPYNRQTEARQNICSLRELAEPRRG